jgi:hypothetical protein
LFSRAFRPFPRRHFPREPAELFYGFFTYGRLKNGSFAAEIANFFDNLLCFYVFSLVQNSRIRNLTANLHMSGVCLEGWWPKNTTNYVCLAGSVWQNIQFDCKFTYVWRLSGRLVAQNTENYVCLEGLVWQNMTKHVCLEGSL